MVSVLTLVFAPCALIEPLLPFLSPNRINLLLVKLPPFSTFATPNEFSFPAINNLSVVNSEPVSLIFKLPAQPLPIVEVSPTLTLELSSIFKLPPAR